MEVTEDDMRQLSFFESGAEWVPIEGLMGKTIIVGENVEGLPISEAVHAGGFIFFSGIVAADAEGRVVPGGIATETDHIFRQVESTLKSIGASLSDIVKVNAILTNPDDFDGFNATYRKHFHTKPPARITTCAQLLIDARVELDLIAYVGDLRPRPSSRPK